METAVDDIALSVGDILEEAESHNCYRIIHLDKDILTMIAMNKKTIAISAEFTNPVMKKVISNDLMIVPESKEVINYDNLSLDAQERFNQRLSIARSICEKFAPDYYYPLNGKRGSSVIQQIADDHKTSTKTVRKIALRYLQSGFDDNSLLDQRIYNGNQERSFQNKVGRPAESNIHGGVVLTDDVLQSFADGLKHYKAQRNLTLAEAYRRMLLEHYCTVEMINGSCKPVLFPITKLPTFRQFSYYCSKHMTAEERDRIKTSAREQRNNQRLLLSDSLNGIEGPCDCAEIDETEVDISLVSVDDPHRTVGRPILHFLVDIYTKMILAYSISFDNNNMIGMTSCLMNLLEDKKEHCAQYGINISKDTWPCKFLPRRIRCDRGAEYTSSETKRIANELHINLDIVPPATGSLKGNVEQLFNQFNISFKSFVEGKGLITKRHDSNHHKEATLDIESFRKFVLSFIVDHNNHYMKTYPRTPEMINESINPIPASLWSYGSTKYGTSQYVISNEDAFLYALLTPEKATLSRRGITYKGLYYDNFNDPDLPREMYEAQNKHVPMDVRIDPRDVSTVYYLRDNALMRATLNPEKTGNAEYAGYTWAEYNKMYSEKKQQDIMGEEHNRQCQIERISRNQEIIKEGKRQRSGNVDPSNMRINRENERQSVQKQNRISNLLPIDERTATLTDITDCDQENGADETLEINPNEPIVWAEIMEECF